MPNISITQASALFTEALVAKLVEAPMATLFLQSFFKSSFRPAKYVRISVRRGTERVAVDIARHSEGNLNITSLTDEKKWQPPHYDEYIILNDHELYDNILGMMASSNLGGETVNNAALKAQLTMCMNEMMSDLVLLREKEIRAVELQCAQALQSGTVELLNGDNIIYPRKATLNVDLGAGNYWDDAGVNPRKAIENLCTEIRKEGLISAPYYDVILGSKAHDALISNEETLKELDNRGLDAGTIELPQMNALGGVYHGILRCGSYKVRIWTYPQYFDNAAGVKTPYIEEGNMVVIPQGANFDIAWTLVPQLIGDNGTIPQTGNFLIKEVRDENKTAHKLHIKCAPLAILTGIDQLATAKVVD